MKTLSKIVLAGSALLSGVAAAQTIPNTGNTTGGSDLVLFVTASDGAYFMDDLGTGLVTIITEGRVTSDFTANNAYNLATGITGSITDTTTKASQTIPNLSTFFSNNAGSTFTWSIMADDATGSNFAAGSTLFGGTSTNALANGSTGIIGNEPSSNFASNSAKQTQTFFALINSTGAVSNGVSTTIGWGKNGTQGQNAPGGYSSGVNGAAVGTAQNLFVAATFGSGNDANIYETTGTYLLTMAGVLTNSTGGGASVPLPAAGWLFGSGLLGLLGVGRRRTVTPVAA